MRGVALSQNDYLLATFSFDCVNLWQIDFSALNNSMNIAFKASIDIVNVLSVLIMPGNKYIVMATKEGWIVMYDINEATVI